MQYNCEVFVLDDKFEMLVEKSPEDETNADVWKVLGQIRKVE